MSDEPATKRDEVVWRSTAAALRDLEEKLWPLIRMETPPKPLEPWVHLIHWGKEKSRVIWALRDKLGLSLAEAKDLVNSAPVRIPVPIARGVDTKSGHRELRNMAFELKMLGAAIEIADDEEWRKVEFDKKFLELFPGLGFRPGWELVAQIYAGPHWGSCRIFTMPPEAPPWREQTDLLDRESVAGAWEFAEALVGDGSPQSYLEASILIRRMRDVGADWHLSREGLSEHKIIGEPSTERTWKWELNDITADSDFEPCVVISKNGHATVTFFSECFYVNAVVMRHRDHYSPNHYVPKSESVRCADGGLGYVH